MPYQTVTDATRMNGATANRVYPNGSSAGRTPDNGRPEMATVGQVTSHASGLAHDLITLVELQAKLLYYDVREVVRRSAFSAVCLAAMTALVLSAIPVVLLGTAELLVQYAEWGRAASYLTVGGATAFIGLIIAWVSFQALRRVGTVLSRSYQEFQENLEFVKSLVKRA
jgi:hypothetical protein